MKQSLIFVLIFVLNLHCNAAKKESVLMVSYVQNKFAIIHENPSVSSAALTTVTCAFPLKVLEDKLVRDTGTWLKVKAGDFTGFILQSHTALNRPDCFQARYPHFFKSLDLDLNELYYWGKLFDQLIEGRSKVN
jgi:hypothetical protein